jgi:hypothetical protein
VVQIQGTSLKNIVAKNMMGCDHILSYNIIPNWILDLGPPGVAKIQENDLLTVKPG